MIAEPICYIRSCSHFLGVKQDNEDEATERVYCKAFPDGIPNEIAYGVNKHLKPIAEQDNDIIFEKAKKPISLLNKKINILESITGGMSKCLPDDFNVTTTLLLKESFVAEEDWDLGTEVIQKGEELHYVLGVVLEPETVDLTTTEKSKGDIYSAEEIRKAAHNFMMRYRGEGNPLQHRAYSNTSVKVVESYISPADFVVNKQTIKKGSWVMGSLIMDNEIWKLVKKGEITGYSVRGKARGNFESPSSV